MSDRHSRDGLDEKALLEKVPSVAAPSGAHNIKKIVELSASVTSHGYGFSFYDPDKMESDTKCINEFIKEARSVRPEEIIKIEEKHKIRIYSVSTIWNTMANPFGRETYKGESQEGKGEGYYIVYAIKYPSDKFLCYSTHEIGINTQLYPVCGDVDGFVQGRGPIDMAVVLKTRGQLTSDKKIALYLVYKQHWQKLDSNDLNNLDPQPPIPQKKLLGTSSGKAPEGGWQRGKKGAQSAAQMSKADTDKYIQAMDLLVTEREKNPTFNKYAFLGLD